jgi:hypothetical protein
VNKEAHTQICGIPGEDPVGRIVNNAFIFVVVACTLWSSLKKAYMFIEHCAPESDPISACPLKCYVSHIAMLPV